MATTYGINYYKVRMLDVLHSFKNSTLWDGIVFHNYLQHCTNCCTTSMPSTYGIEVLLVLWRSKCYGNC